MISTPSCVQAESYVVYSVQYSIHRVYILYMYIIYKLPLCAGQGAKCTIDNIHNTFYIYTVNAFHMLYCIYPSVCRAGSPLHRGLYRGCDILNSYTALVGVNTLSTHISLLFAVQFSTRLCCSTTCSALSNMITVLM